MKEAIEFWLTACFMGLLAMAIIFVVGIALWEWIHPVELRDIGNKHDTDPTKRI